MAGTRESSPKTRSPRGAGVLWWFVLGIPIAAALIVFVAQNTQQVRVHWTVWKVDTSLAVVVLVTILAAVILAEVIGVIWRHRRRRAIARHEAMKAQLAEPPAAPPEAPALEPDAAEPPRAVEAGERSDPS